MSALRRCDSTPPPTAEATGSKKQPSAGKLASFRKAIGLLDFSPGDLIGQTHQRCGPKDVWFNYNGYSIKLSIGAGGSKSTYTLTVCEFDTAKEIIEIEWCQKNLQWKINSGDTQSVFLSHAITTLEILPFGVGRNDSGARQRLP